MPRNFAYGYIENDTARKSSLKKRTPNLLKKVRELSILCGIKACVVVYFPNEADPVFWPSSRYEVETIFCHYEAIPHTSKYAKNMNQETYFKEQNKKLEEKLKQLESSNREMEIKHFLHQIYRAGKTFGEFSRKDLETLEGYTRQRRRVVERRMQFMGREVNETLIENEDPLMEQWVANIIWGTTLYEVPMSQDNNVFNVSNQLPPHQDPSMFGVISGANMLPQGNGEGINNELGGDIAGNNFGATLSPSNLMDDVLENNWPNMYY